MSIGSDEFGSRASGKSDTSATQGADDDSVVAGGRSDHGEAFCETDLRNLLAACEIVCREAPQERAEGLRDGDPVEIYQVRDVNPISGGRVELLYLFHAAAVSQTIRRQIVERIASVAKLGHPNIVPIYRVGTRAETAQVFFTVSARDRASLRDEIDRLNAEGAPMAPRRAAQLILEIASGVSAAHQRQLHHLSLCPERVWLSDNGTPRVAGFGVTWLLEKIAAGLGRAPIEDASPYRLPESCRATEDFVSTDLYGIGAMLYELMTLHPPDVGDALVLPSRYRPDIPSSLEAICLKCLRAKNHQPFASVDELVAALEGFSDYSTLATRTIHRNQQIQVGCEDSMGKSKRRRFANYELLDERPIGKGGMGEVFRVCNRNPILGDRIEALKVIRFTNTTWHAREQFIREVAVMAQLQHPNIVPVYDAGEEAGQLYFTMALEPGGDLAELIQRNESKQLRPGESPMTPNRAAQVVHDIALAIDTAHLHDVIHCDLKPANVLISASGTPRVTDFGLAELIAGRRITEESGGSGWQGSPPYMSPEQARGEPLDRQTDVYSLGAILYELLTKRPPFASDQPGTEGIRETIDAVIHAPLIAPREFDPTIPPELEAICLKSMAKRREDRYATAAELAEALSSFLRPAHWKPTRRAVISTLLAGGLLLASGSVFVIARRQDDILEKALSSVREARRFEESLKYQNALVSYRSAVDAYAELISQPLILVNRSRTELRLDKCPVEMRLAFLDERAGQVNDAVYRIHRVRDDLRALLTSTEILDFLDSGAWRELDSSSSLDGRWPDLSHLLPDRRETTARALLLLAEAYHQDARYHMRQIDYTESVKLYADAIILRRVLSDSDQANTDFKRELARAYGFIADTYLELDRPAARLAYTRAEEIRESLARAEAGASHYSDRCLHARDYGNWCRYFLWQGDLSKALDNARQRLIYYEDQLNNVATLPIDYLTERADAYLMAAELALDVPRLGESDFAAIQDWLQESSREYETLLRKTPDRQLQQRLRAESSRVHLVRGKLAVRRKDPGKAVSELRKAISGVKQATTVGPRYREWHDLARGHALLATVVPDIKDVGYHERRALDMLEEAIRLGFKDVEHAKLDYCFHGLRQLTAKWKTQVEQPMVDARRSLGRGTSLAGRSNRRTNQGG